MKKEKELSRLRDELTQQRRNLPWQEIEKDYTFDGAGGKVKLLDLFGDTSQLLEYHFMFGPDWKDGCKFCSMLADHDDPLIADLNGSGVTLVAVSRALIETLMSHKQRMGWRFEWASSINNEFNRDFGVTFTQEEMEESRMNYNYQLGRFPVTECPGVSSFVRNEQGEIFHTYSAYARGLENLLGIYNFLDLVPRGRDEAELPYGMAWVRHHDRYDDDSFVEPYA